MPANSGFAVHTASSYSELLGAAGRWLEGRTTEALVVAASKGAADDFLRATGKAWMGVHVFTLTQLAAALASADLGARAMTPMSHLSLEALTARVIHEERRREALAYFEPVADTPGFVRALAATLGELRMESADAAALAASGEPGRDLARLLTAFGDQLARQALADRAAIYRAAAGVESHRLLGLPTLILDVPLRHELERSVLRNVVLRAPEAAAFVISADEEAVAAYEAEAAPPTSGDGLLERMRRYLFATELAANPAVDDGSLQFFSTPGEGLECVEIARRLQHLAKAGTRFDGIAIVLRNPEKYQPLLEEALRRAGVPAYFNRGTARPDAAGRAFLALLSCAAGGLSASRFAEYLSLAQVPPLSPEGAAMRVERAYAASADEVLTSFQPADEESTPPVSGATSLATPAGWERLIVDAAVIGGRDRWARRLDGLLNELKNQLKTAEDGAAAGMERRLNQLTALRSFALPLIAQLGELPREAPWSEWIDKLTALAETALRHPEAVLATLNELRPMADVGPASLDEVFGVLRERLRFLRNDPPARRYGQVFVCTPEEIRGRAFEYVFLPGLAEGLFPRRAFEDPLLLDTYRARLGGLAMKDDRVARERLLLKLAAAAASKFVFSYPRMDSAQARPRVPSFYALEIVRAAEGRLPDVRDFEKRAAGASSSRLGWPAPIDSSTAIDDAEYDLSILDGVLRAGPAAPRGAARYLVEVNEHLARSLRTRWRRWQPNWSSADGIADPDLATREVLAAYRLGERAYSATSLQHYSACPYKFLLYAIHGMRPREEPEALEQMDPRTRGVLFHEVQQQLFETLKWRKLWPLHQSKLRETLDIADGLMDGIAAKYAEDLAPAIPRVWTSEIEDMRTDLRGWIRNLSISGVEWEPIDAEHRFDREILGGVKVKGSIDWVERRRNGSGLRVTDHKTGKVPDKAPGYVGGGGTLQPLLYSLVAEQALDQQVLYGRLSYCTQRGGFKEIQIAVTETARSRIGQVIEFVDGAIASGFLPAAPQHEACGRCDFSMVCGPYEERRVKKKDQRRLEPLLILRSQP